MPGLLCDEGEVGVAATTDSDAVSALAADCALYMPSRLELDDVLALLEAGTNVVTTRGELFAGGHRLGDDRRARVVEACTRGSSSIYATGSSPGFITDALPFALLSLQRRVDMIDIAEFANLSRRDSPQMLFELMGFGRPIDSHDPARSSYLLGEFGPPLGVLAEAAGRPVDAWTCSGEVAAARHDTTIVAGEIPAGTVAAQRTIITGSRVAPTSCASHRRGTAPTTSTRRGSSGSPGGTCASRATRRSTSRSAFPVSLDDMAIVHARRSPPTAP